MAQLVGLPIIATDPEGAEAVSLSGAGTIVSPHNDPAAFAAAVEAYRDDPERRRREGENGRRAMLASYDPERVLTAVEQALGLGV